MERPKWTDERLDDRFGSIDAGLDRLDRDMRELRAEMRAGFAEQRQLTYRMFGGLFVALVLSSLLHGGF
ncbi:MAG TPA: hypothetical protein VFX44_06870 [Solirubrobacterales bacterium]|nr:hypothetical protein [Solirubrobacterales bacterium]